MQTLWKVTLTQLMMPQDDGQIWEFYFEERPSKEDVLTAIARKVEQNKDLPEFAEYHSFMYTNVLHIDWLAPSANLAGGTEYRFAVRRYAHRVRNPRSKCQQTRQVR